MTPKEKQEAREKAEEEYLDAKSQARISLITPDEFIKAKRKYRKALAKIEAKP